MRLLSIAVALAMVGCGHDVAAPDLAVGDSDLAIEAPADLSVPDLAMAADLAEADGSAPADAEVVGPDLSCGAGLKSCGDSCIASASCCSAADCTSPPAPAACYSATCSAPGGSCSYALKSGSALCFGGTVCCNPIHGTCSSGMGCLTCANNYADCNADPSDGCETDLVATSQKKCGAGCIPDNTCCSDGDCTSLPSPCYVGHCSGAGGSCSYSLPSGVIDCHNGTCCAPLPNATPACMPGGGCGILVCNPGYVDCNHIASDGCETYCNGFAVTCGAACPTSCNPANGSGCAYGFDCVGGTACTRKTTGSPCTMGLECPSGMCINMQCT